MMVVPPRRRSAGTILALAVLALWPMQSASASLLSIVAPLPVLLPGQSETISIQFTSTQAFTLGATDLEVSYDSTRFTASNVTTGSLDAGFSFASNTSVAGFVAGSFASGTGTPIAVGQTGTLETFTLTALGTAPVGGTVGNINILEYSPFGLGTSTAVYDLPGNSIVLTPPPTNGYDPTVDGTVLIGASVPEPSSIILMGLGGGLFAVAARSRKKARRASASAA